MSARLHSGRRDGLRLARCFGHHQGMIRRFATDLAAGFTCHHAERDVHPVKVQQRTSGGCWRTLAGLAGFAVVRSSLSTAHVGHDHLNALTGLFTTGPLATRRRQTRQTATLR